MSSSDEDRDIDVVELDAAEAGLTAGERFRARMQAQGLVRAQYSDDEEDDRYAGAYQEEYQGEYQQEDQGECQQEYQSEYQQEYQQEDQEDDRSIISYSDDGSTVTGTSVSGTSYTSQSTAVPLQLPAPHDLVSSMHAVFVAQDPRSTGRVPIARLLHALQADLSVRRFMGIALDAELPVPRLPERLRRTDVTWEGFVRDFASAFTTRGSPSPSPRRRQPAEQQQQQQQQSPAAEPTEPEDRDPDVVGALNAYMGPLTALFAEYSDPSGALSLPGFHRLLSQRHVTPTVTTANTANAAFADASPDGTQALTLPGFLRALAELAASALCDVELLLARMDPEGLLFGPELLARRGDEARQLGTRQREARWKAGMQAMKNVRRGPNLQVQGKGKGKGKGKARRASPAAAASAASRRDDTKMYERNLEHQQTIERQTRALREQLEQEEQRELTFRPRINNKSRQQPTLSFEERQRQAEEQRQLNLLRIRQEEFEKQEVAMRKNVTLNPRSKKILEKNGRLFESTEERLAKLHRSRQAFFKEKETQRNESAEETVMFQPAINRTPASLHKDRHGTGSSEVAEALYRNAFQRKLRRQMAAQQVEEQATAARNQPKINAASEQLLRSRLEKQTRQLFGEFSDEDTATLSYPRMEDVLRSVDCFAPSKDAAADAERLRRVWQLLEPVTLPSLLWFTLAVAGGDDSDPPAGVDQAAAGAVVREFRTLRANAALTRPTRQQELGFSRALAVDRPVDPECTFAPRINRKSRKMLEASKEPDDLPTPDRLAMTRHLTERKLVAAREEQVRQELASCTFHPQVNAGVPKAVIKAARKAGAPVPKQPETANEDGDRAVAMYEDFLTKRSTEERRRKAGLIKTTGDREFEENCTFHPEVAPAPPRAPPPKRQPKGYEKDVERMRQAAADREQRRLEADLIGHGRIDVDRHRNAQGQITRGIKPFNLQTGKRSERREQLRNQQRQAEAEAKRQERRGANQRRQQDKAQAMSAAAEAEAEAKLRAAGPPLLFVDVNISADRSERVAVWRDDDPGRIARDFCARHLLGAGTAEKLRTMLVAQMENALGHRLPPRSPSHSPDPRSPMRPPPIKKREQQAVRSAPPPSRPAPSGAPDSGGDESEDDVSELLQPSSPHDAPSHLERTDLSDGGGGGIAAMLAAASPSPSS